ncbi:MAG: DUF4190 domain-containing protein [Bifidobacteriaceae bacterium]|jgi:hypothetical protein|nr:DUF4190 domain-containing protein [Bifidobacteriaceae bacterium]
MSEATLSPYGPPPGGAEALPAAAAAGGASSAGGFAVPPVPSAVAASPYGPPAVGPAVQPVALPVAPAYPLAAGYYLPQQYVVMPTQTTNGMSIASLCCSLAALFIVPWLGSILGVIFGGIGLHQTKRNGQNGRGLAIAGIVIGIVGFVAWLVLFWFFLFRADRYINPEYYYTLSLLPQWGVVA